MSDRRESGLGWPDEARPAGRPTTGADEETQDEAAGVAAQASEDDPDPYARSFAIEQLTGPGDEDD